MEASFLEKASIQEPKYFFELSREAFQSSREMTDRWVKQYQDDPIENSPGFVYQQYWKKQNRAAGMMI